MSEGVDVRTSAHVCACLWEVRGGCSSFLRGLDGMAETPDTLCLRSPLLWRQARALSLLPHVINKPSSGRDVCRARHWWHNLPSANVCAHKITSAWSCVEFLKSKMCPKPCNKHGGFFYIYSILCLGFSTWVVHLDPFHSTISLSLLLCTHLTPSQVHDLLFSNYYCYVCVRACVIQPDESV